METRSFDAQELPAAGSVRADAATARGPGLKASERQHRVAVNQVRAALTNGVAGWLSWAGVDYFVTSLIGPAVFWQLLTLRVALAVIPVALTWRLWRAQSPSPRMLHVSDASVFIIGAFGIGMTSLWFGGLQSLYAPGLMLVLVARGAFIQQSWRESIYYFGGILVTYFATVLACVCFSPTLQPQLTAPESWGYFALHFALGVWTAAFVMLASHRAWALRQRVFEQCTVGDYRVGKLLGSGGFGEVWEALHVRTDRLVALKVLRLDKGDDWRAQRRFEHELRATARLDHPHIVRVFGGGVTDEGVWYYAMERLQGEDLARLVQRRGPMEPRRVVELAASVAGALEEAHERGILHRDLKPENLFVQEPTGSVKVLDFGLAKLRQGERNATLTRTGAIVGTPEYMAPEVCLGRWADERSDVYSLGAALYYALTGTAPFSGASPMATLMAHVSEPLIPPSDRVGRPLPHALECIVERCLAKDSKERFASMRELHAALEQCAAGTRQD